MHTNIHNSVRLTSAYSDHDTNLTFLCQLEN